jgi:peptide deformylase
MAEREILHLGNPILWEKSAPVEDVSSQDTVELIHDLDDTLAAFRKGNGFGRGIAAPQIGMLKRVIFIRMGDGGFTGALINPRIVWADEAMIELWDACFSLPSLMVKVARAAKVKVEHIDSDGLPQVLEAEEDFSELLQHEIDHLDGILAVQRALTMKSFSTREQWKRFYADEAT